MNHKLIFCVVFFVLISSAFVTCQIPNIECNSQNQGRHFPSGYNCTSYFTCFNQVFHLQNCPDPFWFNYERQACVYPENAECNLGPGDGIECNTANHGRHFPTNYNCTSYYTCFNGNFILGNCPDSFVFVYDRQACVYYPGYDCNLQGTTTPPTISTTPIPTECPATGIARIPNLLSCTRYYFCFAGFRLERSCSDGLHFSRSLLKCVRAEESDCKVESIKCPQTNDPNDIVFLPNVEDCQKYYICYNGIPVESDCGPTLHFDPVNNWCIKEENSSCESPIELPDIREIECPAASMTRLIFVPHPQNCQFYFICFDNRSHLMRCAQNLLFDHVIGECFFKDFARCYAG